MSANDNALCSTFGLCCNGWMFSAATPAAGEVARFRQLTALVGDRVPQPCVFHDGACCSIYDMRPSGCRSFRCDTLEGLLAGGVDLDVARARVSRAQSAIEAVTREMHVTGWIATGESPAVAWMRLVTSGAATPAMGVDERRRHAGLLIAAAAAVRALKALAGPIDMG